MSPTVYHVARAVGSTTSSTPEYQVAIRTGSHQLAADEPTPDGGTDTAPSPFGLLSSALAACTVNTLRMYAKRKEWDLASIEVDIRFNTDDERRFSIERTVTLPADFPPDPRDRLAEIAERTPVTRAIREGVPITTTVLPLTP